MLGSNPVWAGPSSLFHLILVCVYYDLKMVPINSRLHARLHNQLSHPITQRHTFGFVSSKLCLSFCLEVCHLTRSRRALLSWRHKHCRKRQEVQLPLACFGWMTRHVASLGCVMFFTTRSSSFKIIWVIETGPPRLMQQMLKLTWIEVKTLKIYKIWPKWQALTWFC